MGIRKAVFPAAGLGTRFLPATKAQPKEMLPIVDKPTIQYVVEEAVASGIKDIVIVTGRGKNAIEDHFDRSMELEMMLQRKGRTDLLEVVHRVSELIQVCYVRQKEPLGLGHAILAARDLVGNEPFATLLGDDILTDTVPALQQMMRVYEAHRCSVMLVKRVPRSEVSRYGVIKARKIDEHLYHIMDMVEKPEVDKAPSDLALIGRYILTPEIFPILAETASDRTGGALARRRDRPGIPEDDGGIRPAAAGRGPRVQGLPARVAAGCRRDRRAVGPGGLARAISAGALRQARGREAA
ncbi:MAG: galU [candidate division NC10 bacterium]|nr:galU [candidate division NC10 bacterium]